MAKRKKKPKSNLVPFTKKMMKEMGVEFIGKDAVIDKRKLQDLKRFQAPKTDVPRKTPPPPPQPVPGPTPEQVERRNQDLGVY